MSRRLINKVFTFIGASILSVSAFADGGTVNSYTPYSLFALGDLTNGGTAYNRSMGGVGIASRNNKFINILNPAAVTARDSLAFMVDFSVNQENKFYKQDSRKSAYNIFNIGDCVISFPIYGPSAMMVGIIPYSGVGYDFTYSMTDKNTLANLGSVSSTYNGTGGIYQCFAAAGVTFFKRLSIGAEFMYYFGNIERNFSMKYSNTAIPSISEVKNVEMSSISGKFGVQYEQPLGKNLKLGFGATYKLDNNLGGYLQNAVTSTTGKIEIDTLKNTPGRLHMPSELGLGISLNYSDKFRAEIDYTRSDWRNSNFETDPFFVMTESSMPFTASVSQTFRIGVEWVPNKNDIRYYFKKVAYRAGAYYKKDYFCVAGRNINSYGVTIGATLPIFRWSNGFTIGVDFGKRGSLSGGLVRENYINISAGVNLFDIWFQKPKYE